MLKNPTIKRIVFSLVLVIFLIPPFIISAFGGPIGRIIGLILISLVAMLAYFEVLHALTISKMVSFFCSLAIPLFMILPLGIDFDNLIWHSSSTGDYAWSMPQIIRFGFGNYIPWLVPIFFGFLPLLLDNKIAANKKFLAKQAIIVITTFIVCIFAKFAWLVSIVNFTFFAFLILIGVISDTMGYFGGLFFGKKWFKGKKLAPKISPKKTWAGFLFSVFFASTFAILYGYYMHVWKDFNNELVFSIIFGLILTLIAPLGDLLFSFIKRQQKIKDFSNLIPGHGGIFDRLDAISLVFCFALFFYAFI